MAASDAAAFSSDFPAIARAEALWRRRAARRRRDNAAGCHSTPTQQSSHGAHMPQAGKRQESRAEPGALRDRSDEAIAHATSLAAGLDRELGAYRSFLFEVEAKADVAHMALQKVLEPPAAVRRLALRSDMIVVAPSQPEKPEATAPPPPEQSSRPAQRYESSAGESSTVRAAPAVAVPLVVEAVTSGPLSGGTIGDNPIEQPVPGDGESMGRVDAQATAPESSADDTAAVCGPDANAPEKAVPTDGVAASGKVQGLLAREQQAAGPARSHGAVLREPGVLALVDSAVLHATERVAATLARRQATRSSADSRAASASVDSDSESGAGRPRPVDVRGSRKTASREMSARVSRRARAARDKALHSGHSDAWRRIQGAQAHGGESGDSSSSDEPMWRRPLPGLSERALAAAEARLRAAEVRRQRARVGDGGGARLGKRGATRAARPRPARYTLPSSWSLSSSESTDGDETDDSGVI